ncbi:MAG: DNA-3-methyladenine glycosylase I [Chloroflexi bacterium]|nr:DNA-3-methyladenine glycosylase I [Chloroflexota bacterium]MBI2759722.1 DNA-3-methyladenine glycosylase I [Chloroflexota bacterium]
MASYCAYCNSHPEDAFNKVYHDTQYGFPIEEDHLLFERLVLEINQAGLSWITILKKQDNFRRAYHSFDIDKMARCGEKDRARLLADAGIIRNKLKINAAIENAKRIQLLRAEYGSFKGWLDSHHPLGLDEWIKLFKKTFIFTGGEIVREFLVSTGYVAGAHDEDCPIYKKVARLHPAWTKV